MTLSQEPLRLSAKREWLFRVVLLLVMALTLELASCVALRLLNRRYPMDPMAEITEERVETFLKKAYDPELGWKVDRTRHTLNSLGARSTREYPDISRTISVYGDSYVFGSGVPVEEAWTSLLEKKSGVGVLNFGVQGYGSDQALLRLERQQSEVPSPTVLLCILAENINRCVNVYAGFYRPGFNPPKPRFVLAGSRLTVYNPFSSAAEARDILLYHPDRLIAIAKEHDHWYRELELFGRPWRIAFPYSLQLAARARYCVNRIRSGFQDSGTHIPLFMEGSDSLQLLKAILARFRDLAKDRDFKGLVLVFPTVRDVRTMQRTGKVGYQPLLEFMRKDDIPYLDLADTIAQQPDVERLYVDGEDHFNRPGGELVSSRILEFLRERDALPGEIGSEPRRNE